MIIKKLYFSSKAHAKIFVIAEDSWERGFCGAATMKRRGRAIPTCRLDEHAERSEPSRRELLGEGGGEGEAYSSYVLSQ